MPVVEHANDKNPQPQSLQRILIVEDLPDARQSLQELLSLTLHVAVDVAEDGTHARCTCLPSGLIAWSLPTSDAENERHETDRGNSGRKNSGYHYCDHRSRRRPRSGSGHAKGCI